MRSIVPANSSSSCLETCPVRAAVSSRVPQTIALGLCVLIMAVAVASPCAAGGVTPSTEARAERFFPWNMDHFVVNGDIRQHWIGKEDRFWYARTDSHGDKRFIVVNARDGSRSAAFDQKRVAEALSRLLQSKVNAGQLPFTHFSYADQRGEAIRFRVKGTWIRCELKRVACIRESQLDTAMPGELLSPNGKWAVSLRGHDLWIRAIGSNERLPLTTDGVAHYGYAGPLGSSGYTVMQMRHPVPVRPLGIWSPDSRYFATHRLDERKVKDLYLIQSVPEDGSMRPKLYRYRYAMPGDKDLPLLEPVVIDVVTRRRVFLATKPLVASIATLVERRDMWWSADSRKLYFLKRGTFGKSLALEEGNPVTGAVRELVGETSDAPVTQISGYLAVRALANGDIIWYSRRSGRGQLYYYSGATGALRNQITRGHWIVRSIVRVDERAKRIYFMASGRERDRDPYEQYLYSVRFDGSGLQLLTPEVREHELAAGAVSGSDDEPSTPWENDRFSFSGRYFVDSYSTPNIPPIFVVRRADGRLVKRLERADISQLRDGGYTPVEPFKALAADGKTAIYGNLYRPSNFDPNRKYAIIDSIYSLPTAIRTGKSFGAALFGYFEAQSLAELGFIVVTVDGRGTAFRSNAFSDYSYGNWSKTSDIADHIAAIRQLAKRYPYMDLNRVGADGVSAGGYGAAHAILAYPDFYKVAVVADGNQDQGAGPAALENMLMGPMSKRNYLASSNLPLARNLKGKLLLAHGEMDETASPSLTLKLVDALVKADKPFDMLIIPNETHLMFIESPYFIHRKWDYFVRNLGPAQ